jgi:hypothetical protein
LNRERGKEGYIQRREKKREEIWRLINKENKVSLLLTVVLLY